MAKNRTMWDDVRPEPPAGDQPPEVPKPAYDDAVRRRHGQGEMPAKANDRQEGGDHYRKHGAAGEQHWDRVIRLYPDCYWAYFAAAVTKYVERYRDKGGLEDLRKARHYLDKLIETHEARGDCPAPAGRPATTTPVLSPPLAVNTPYDDERDVNELLAEAARDYAPAPNTPTQPPQPDAKETET